MNLVCVICSELLIPSDDVFHTPCGHIFHFVCLTQWLERSKSCPQCRERTTETKIRRLYFNFSNNDTIVEDASSLQDQIDKLKFQILLKDKDIKHYSEKNVTLEKQNAGLRNHVKTVESKVSEQQSAIRALQEQTTYLKKECEEVNKIRQQLVRLQKKLDDLRSVQVLMDGPAEEVDEMIAKTRDVSALITYVSVMKREMDNNMNKRRELRNKVRNLQQELTKVSMERNYLLDEHDKRKKLEDELMMCESKKVYLENKIKTLEETNSLCNNTKGNSEKAAMVDAETSTTDIENIRTTENAGIVLRRSAESKKEKRLFLSLSDEEVPPSPVKSHSVPVQQQQFFTLKSSSSSGLSILTKKPRLPSTEIVTREKTDVMYDGFGGHGRLEKFPSSVGVRGTIMKVKRPKEDVYKQKRPKLDTGGNYKLSNFISALQ